VIQAVGFCLVLTAIRYTYGQVIAKLAMVEPSDRTMALAPESDDPDAPLLTPEEKLSEKRPLAEPELIVKVAPITSKYHTAMAHLRAHAGPYAGFRGASLWFAYHMLLTLVFNLLCMALPFSIPRQLFAVLATVMLSRWNMMWTHIVISMPSSKKWWRQRPDLKAWKKVAPATALWAVAERVTYVLPAGLWRNLGLDVVFGHHAIREMSASEKEVVLIKFIMVILVFIATAVLVLVPATVTLVRVQASMLPEENEAIVPFDRTFGGKVVSEAEGGSGKLGLLDAWRTFDRASRIRLLKLYVKVGVCQAVVSAFFVGLIALEVLVL